MRMNPDSPDGRVERELERERRERMLHDDERTGLSLSEELRIKDARENAGAANLRRSNAH
jgi:hypothetical protein